MATKLSYLNTEMDWHNPKAAERFKPGEEMTGPYASALVHMSGLSKASSAEKLVVLDNACGTGIAALLLYSLLPEESKDKLSLTCGDISNSMVESVAQRIIENEWKGAQAQVADAMALPFPNDTFTHVLDNFGTVGIPNPRLVLREIHRVLRPNGIAAFSIWKHVGWFPIFERAIATIPEAPPMRSFADFCTHASTEGDQFLEGDFIQSVAKETGFVDVSLELVGNVSRHRDAELFCQLYGGMFRLVLQCFWGQEQTDKLFGLVEPAVLRVLKEEFGEGEVSLQWTAWCVTARKSGAP